MQFVVLSSSRGTTFQAVLDAKNSGALQAECMGLITDRADRGCIEKARAAEIPVMIVEKRVGESREGYDRRLHEALIILLSAKKGSRPADAFLACMGWMFVFSPWFTKQWSNRILNVHPALLPKYGGEGMYGSHVHEAVLQAKEKQSGMTIHLIDDGVDTGNILLQKTCPVLPADTPETLQVRVQELEKEWYPKVLEMLEHGHVKI